LTLHPQRVLDRARSGSVGRLRSQVSLKARNLVDVTLGRTSNYALRIDSVTFLFSLTSEWSFPLVATRVSQECSRGKLTIRFFVLQIAPSKKLWSMDEGGSKDEGGVKGGGTLLHLGDHQTTMWRDTTWSTSGRTSSPSSISMASDRSKRDASMKL